jgi:hypothetical protein
MSANSASGNLAQTLNPSCHITTTTSTTHLQQPRLRSTPSPPIAKHHAHQHPFQQATQPQRASTPIPSSRKTQARRIRRGQIQQETESVHKRGHGRRRRRFGSDGEGKKGSEGEGKGRKTCQVRCPHLPRHSLLTSFRKTAANRAQDDAVADAAGPPSHLTRYVHAPNP